MFFKKIQAAVTKKSEPASQLTSLEQLYKNIYDHIASHYGSNDFSPSKYASEEIRKFLIDNSLDCVRLHHLILHKNSRAAADDSDPKICDKILTAFNDLLDPKKRRAMYDSQMLGMNQIDGAPSRLMMALENYSPDPAKPYRVLLLGDIGTGKESIATSFIEQRFRDFQEPRAQGARQKPVYIDDTHQVNLRTEVYDNQARFRDQPHGALRGFDGVVIVFDITDAESFRNIKQWHAEMERYGTEGTSYILVGNKCDMKAQRAVDSYTAKDFAESLGMKYVECSAITNQNITEVFKTLGNDMRTARFRSLEENTERFKPTGIRPPGK